MTLDIREEPAVRTGIDQSHEDVAPSGMVLIPEGTFHMGSNDGGEFERPVHEVHLDGFFMDETLVTNAEFAEFADATGYHTSAERVGKAWGHQGDGFAEIPGLSWRTYAGADRCEHPVVLVSWFDAVAYAEWAGKRLPTEAEWEKAARGGIDCGLYPWGNEEPDARHGGFSRPPTDIPPTSAIKDYPANGYGLYGIVGNVWQWCADWYSDAYYENSPSHNPCGPEFGEFRVRRGGSWNVIQNFRLRCANRGAVDGNTAVPNIGIRCAKSIV